ncbi:hypothetical protein N7466_001817 [Penicillium verhagenii]|uniref:uncharacterized protein n=1 Tax=Penicillium verhagenii TaxID=1562060 RepID=UPI0025451221|nr:uncharacterized protein N7466_001817 [Penicillium verhagenii]KAJ5938683.1 hypothetical protein N7466_001817 [Penicillium verhagenii]
MPLLHYDILCLIADYLDGKDRRQMLLVCRQWYLDAFFKAYERVEVEGHQAYRLARAVQRNPQIGRAIQFLTLEWSSTRDKKSRNSIKPFKNTLQQASPSNKYRTEWGKDLMKGDPDAWFAMLTVSLESVRALTLEFNGSAKYLLTILARAAASERPFDSNPMLRRLEWVRIRNCSEFDAPLSTMLFPLLEFPALRVFSADGICECPDQDYFENKRLSTRASGIKGIKQLYLRRCNAKFGLKEFIESSISLEVFDYQHRDKVIRDEQGHTFCPNALYTSLYTQKHSLRVLRINNNGDTKPAKDWIPDGEDINWGAFGSLARFHRLRELRIPWRPLMGYGMTGLPMVSLVDILPFGLEYLQLVYHCREDLGPMVETLENLLTQRERFPNLKVLEIQDGFPEWMTRSMGYSMVSVSLFVIVHTGRLHTMCEQLGIDFKLVPRFTRDEPLPWPLIEV